MQFELGASIYRTRRTFLFGVVDENAVETIERRRKDFLVGVNFRERRLFLDHLRWQPIADHNERPDRIR